MKRFFRPLYYLAGILALLLAAVVCGLALIPAVWLVATVWQWTGGIESFWDVLFISLSIGLGYFLFGCCLMLVVVLVRNLFRIKNEEGRSLIFSKGTLTFATYDFLVGVVRFFILPFVRSTPLMNLFYLGMGAKIGKNVLIATDRFWDCDLVEIGDDCVIGGNVAINAHIGQGKKGRMRRIRIGNRVTIGADAYLMPGVVIEDDVLIGPNSVIPMGMKLEANSVYWGIPVEKVADRN